MRPRWSLYLRWRLPGHWTSWQHEGDFFLKRRAWKWADTCSRWHLCDTRIRRYGEPM